MQNQTAAHSTPNAANVGGNQALVGVLNHEIRTPLTVLLAHAEFLQDEGVGLTQDVQRSVAAIARATRRLADVADAITRFADLDLGTTTDPVLSLNAQLAIASRPNLSAVRY